MGGSLIGFGIGGMSIKIIVVDIVICLGVEIIIVFGLCENVLVDLVNG